MADLFKRDTLTGIEDFKAENFVISADVHQNSVAKLECFFDLSLGRLELNIKRIGLFIESYLHNFLYLLKPVGSDNYYIIAQALVNYFKRMPIETFTHANPAFKCGKGSIGVRNNLFETTLRKPALAEAHLDMFGINKD